MILKRIGPLSLAKISGILYGIMGLFFGFVIAAVSMAASFIGSAIEGGREDFPGFIFGIIAIFAAPVMYGLMGFLSGLVTALIYNLLAGMIGGVELEFDEKSAASAQNRGRRS